MAGTKEPATATGSPDAYFRSQLATGRIMLQRSRKTGRCFFYPRIAEPQTGDTDLEWIEASGLGTVYSTTIVRQRPDRGGDYNIALIDLDEGGRMLSRVEDITPDQVHIGMRVKAHIGAIDGETVILFSPAEGGV